MPLALAQLCSSPINNQIRLNPAAWLLPATRWAKCTEARQRLGATPCGCSRQGRKVRTVTRAQQASGTSTLSKNGAAVSLQGDVRTAVMQQVAMLQGGDAVQQQAAATELHQLVTQGKPTAKAATASVVMETGAVPSLLQMLQSNSPEAEPAAADVLEALLQCDDSPSRFLTLVRMLKSDSPAAHVAAAKVVKRIATQRSNHQSIEDASIVPLLVTLLQSTSSSPMVQSAVSEAVSTLAETGKAARGSKSIELPASVIPPLGSLLSSNHSIVQHNAIKALRALVKYDPAYQETMKDAGVMQPLISLLLSPNPRQVAATSGLLLCLLEGLRQEEARALLLAAGGHSQIAYPLRHGLPDARFTADYMLRILEGSPEDSALESRQIPGVGTSVPPQYNSSTNPVPSAIVTGAQLQQGVNALQRTRKVDIAQMLQLRDAARRVANTGDVACMLELLGAVDMARWVAEEGTTEQLQQALQTALGNVQSGKAKFTGADSMYLKEDSKPDRKDSLYAGKRRKSQEQELWHLPI